MFDDHLFTAPESAQLARLERFDSFCLETVCAMANARGGMILLPIAFSGAAHVSEESTLNGWIQQICVSTQPAIIPEGEIQAFDSRRVVILRVPEAPIKPVAVAGRCYQRAGSTNYLLSAAEIARLHLQSVGQSWDAVPREEAAFTDLDEEKARAFVKLAQQKRRLQLSEPVALAETLESEWLLVRGKATPAAILLFAKHPQQFFSHARIKAGRFKSETTIVDDQEITGSLFEQINAAFAFIQKHLTVRLVITGQPEREEVWDYPLEALREGLINAVCHRDYSVAVETQIRIYDDQLIIWNPGSLPPDLRLEDLKRRHHSVLRNKLIGAAFYQAGLIEKWGSGTNRILAECRRHGLPEPEWREQQGLMLILRKDPFTEDFLLDAGLNERQIKAVAHVKKRRRITNQEYQQLVEVKKRTASEELRDLEEKKVFERVGSTGKGTYYKLRGRV